MAVVMDGWWGEMKETMEEEKAVAYEMQKGKMGYLRHSPPIWWRDCVVKTLGLLAVTTTAYASFVLGSTDTWRQLAGSIYEFQGYVNNLLRLDCSYANKWTLYIYTLTH